MVKNKGETRLLGNDAQKNILINIYIKYFTD